MFQRSDANFDRRVSREEFTNSVGEMEKWGISIEDPDSTFDAIDTNGGGMILFDEFCEWAIA